MYDDEKYDTFDKHGFDETDCESSREDFEGDVCCDCHCGCLHCLGFTERDFYYA